MQPSNEVGIRSPFSGSGLGTLLVPDLAGLFGLDEFSCIDRDQAMSIPGVARGRGILLSLIPDKPLAPWRGAESIPVSTQAWLQRTPGTLSPWDRMADTIDDFIFYPYSLWKVVRGAADTAGRRPIVDAVHIDYDIWGFDSDTRIIWIDGDDGEREYPTPDEVILFRSPTGGLLNYTRRTLSGSASLERTWVTRAGNPSPITELHITDDAHLEESELTDLQSNWVTARNAVNGAVAVTPAGVTVIDHGTADPALFVEGRNSSRMDIASFFNMPGAILDATTAQASLTYVTQEGTRTSLYDLTLPFWIRPIESRLSQDDVVPSGQSVRFDFSSLTSPNPTPIVTED